MPAANFTIRINMSNIPRQLINETTGRAAWGHARDLRIFGGAKRAALDAGMPFIARQLALNTPVGVTGHAKQAVHFVTTPFGGHVGYAEPAASYIEFVNDGTRPHAAPFDPILLWATRKGFDRFAAGGIWRGILEHGTEPQRFVEKTYEEVLAPVHRIMDEAVQAFIRSLEI